jgi:hypothetical protein
MDRIFIFNVIAQVRPQHRHLRHGLLRGFGPPRPERGAQAPQGRTCRLPPPPRQGGRNEMVPDQVSSSFLSLVIISWQGFPHFSE